MYLQKVKNKQKNVGKFFFFGRHWRKNRIHSGEKVSIRVSASGFVPKFNASPTLPNNVIYVCIPYEKLKKINQKEWHIATNSKRQKIAYLWLALWTGAGVDLLLLVLVEGPEDVAALAAVVLHHVQLRQHGGRAGHNAARADQLIRERERKILVAGLRNVEPESRPELSA
jgi:hypothetical protein